MPQIMFAFQRVLILWVICMTAILYTNFVGCYRVVAIGFHFFSFMKHSHPCGLWIKPFKNKHVRNKPCALPVKDPWDLSPWHFRLKKILVAGLTKIMKSKHTMQKLWGTDTVCTEALETTAA